MPSTSSSSATRHPIVYLIAKADQRGEHTGPDDRDPGRARLVAERGEPAAVEEAVDAAGRCRGGQEADQHGADDAADEVDADDVERVVEVEPELQADGVRTGDAGDRADRDRARRRSPHRRTA